MIIRLLIFLSFSLYSNQTILVDAYFSPYAGANDLLLGDSLLLGFGDCFNSLNSKYSITKIMGRAVEQVFIWEPINMLTAITQHEVFGHGYRLRELHENVLGYEINIDGGATYFDVDSSFKVGKLLAVSVAGLEAESIMARIIKMHWIQKGQIDGRQSTLYTQCEQSLFWYTLLTNLGRLEGEDDIEGNDVDSYMFLLNASYPDSNINIGDLTRMTLVNWLDPMTFYAYFSWCYYIAKGKSWTFPMIPIAKGIRYLPNARVGYAPYGVEFYFENFFSIQKKPLYFYFKGGKRSRGLGVAYDYIFSSEKGSLGFCFDAWKQNQFLTSSRIGELEEGVKLSNPDFNNKVWGFSASITSVINISPKIGLYGEIGGKTKGYLPGYSLDTAIVWRVGLTFNNSIRYK